MRKCLQILNLIDQLVFIFQSDKIPISECYSFSILQEISKLELTNKEKSELATKVNVKKDFIYRKQIHGLGFLLDPKYLGEGLSDAEE